MTYPEIEQLKVFYKVQTIQELVETMAMHIDRLQAKLNALQKRPQNSRMKGEVA